MGRATFADMLLLSATATLRTIVVLLVLLWLLRWYLRSSARTSSPPVGAPQRPKGDVRIENAPPQSGRDRDQGIIDAEFEEIK